MPNMPKRERLNLLDNFGSLVLNAWSFCREIVDIHEKENALDIVTGDRVYHIVAESPEDARYGVKQKLFLSLSCFLYRSNS